MTVTASPSYLEGRGWDMAAAIEPFLDMHHSSGMPFTAAMQEAMILDGKDSPLLQLSAEERGDVHFLRGLAQGVNEIRRQQMGRIA